MLWGRGKGCKEGLGDSVILFLGPRVWGRRVVGVRKKCFFVFSFVCPRECGLEKVVDSEMKVDVNRTV